jgi:hypothetical protein
MAGHGKEDPASPHNAVPLANQPGSTGQSGRMRSRIAPSIEPNDEGDEMENAREVASGSGMAGGNAGYCLSFSKIS